MRLIFKPLQSRRIKLLARIKGRTTQSKLNKLSGQTSTPAIVNQNNEIGP
jgi:hypothetical protein